MRLCSSAYSTRSRSSANSKRSSSSAHNTWSAVEQSATGIFAIDHVTLWSAQVRIMVAPHAVFLPWSEIKDRGPRLSVCGMASQSLCWSRKAAAGLAQLLAKTRHTEPVQWPAFRNPRYFILLQLEFAHIKLLCAARLVAGRRLQVFTATCATTCAACCAANCEASSAR